MVPIAWLAPLLLVPAVGSSRPQDSDEELLKEAARLLADTAEGKVREGGAVCVRVDTPAAVDLLLDVLDETTQTRGLPPAHYRDVVWESLTEIRDHYARMRLEEVLAKDKKNADLRLWCAELLGIYGEHEFGETLTKALSDKAPRVQCAAARSLGMLGYESASKSLVRLTRSKEPRVRADAILSLARIDPEGECERLVTALARDKDGGVRCALLGAIPELLPGEIEALSVAALEDDDWRPRIQAVQNLGAVKTKSSVDRLIAATEDGRPVVREEALRALRGSTGQRHSKKEAWEAWWEENRETFDFPEGIDRGAPDDERTVATYHGIQLKSDHVAFLIDKSARMNDVLETRGVSKDEAAFGELANVLSTLEGDLVFNVYTYERRVEAFEEEPVELGKKTCKKALEFVEGRPCQDRKDIWQVLERVVSDPDLDTVYLLSSGEPDIGLYVHWNRVTRHLKDLNRFHKVVVHSIAFTKSERYQSQLEKISEATGGEFRAFD